MKKIYSLFFVLALAIGARADVITITQSGLTFSPASVSVNVGDVIHWVWTGGTHNTTSNAATIPVGAAVWAAPLTAGSPTFDYTVEVAGTYGYGCTFHADMGMVGVFTAASGTQVEPVLTAVSDFTVGVDYNSHTLHVKVENFSNAHTTLKMMDITGRTVANLMDGELGTGEQLYHFDVAAHTAGIYFVRMEQNGKVTTRKVLLN